METVFKKYPSIENSYQGDFVQKIMDNGYRNIPYCITEKIHGSNSQITYNLATKEFVLGKRNDILPVDETFYNLQHCTNPLKPAIAELALKLEKQCADIGQRVLSVTVFGEVFGGSYPHPDVPKDKDAFKVQKGVFYAPSNHWLAFDVGYMIAGSDRMYFLPASLFIGSCLSVGIPIVPVLAIVNTLDEALNYPCDGQSLVFEQYDLPKLEDNIMEGVVIRPQFKDVWFGNSRLILKHKNDKFKEKWKERKEVSTEVELPANVKQAIAEISSFVTESRVQNVISHIGEVTEKDIGRLIGMCSKDALEDYRKEFKTLDFMEKQEEKMVTKQLNTMMSDVVRKTVFALLQWKRE